MHTYAQIAAADIMIRLHAVIIIHSFRMNIDHSDDTRAFSVFDVELLRQFKNNIIIYTMKINMYEM